MHWYICQLHVNELNLREVYVKLDGTTTGPKSFSELIGKTVAGAVETAPVVDFNPVPSGVESADSDVLLQLSHGQSLLYQLAVGVQSGHVTVSVANRKIETLNHARNTRNTESRTVVDFGLPSPVRVCIVHMHRRS